MSPNSLPGSPRLRRDGRRAPAPWRPAGRVRRARLPDGLPGLSVGAAARLLCPVAARSTAMCSARRTSTSFTTSPTQDRLGLITANATTPYILNFIDLGETGPLVIELPAGPDRRRRVGLLAARDRCDGRDGARQGEGRQAPDRGAGQSAPPDADGLLRAAGDGHEHHVRVPHARPRSAARARRLSTRCGSIPTPSARILRPRA